MSYPGFKHSEESKKKMSVAHWRGGRYITKKGYVMVMTPDRGYVFEHRIVMESHIGRKLRKGETIHHLDGDRTNNKIENLRYFENHSIHLRHENRKGSKSPTWKGGRRKAEDRIYIYMPSHPHATKQGYVAENRLVMENHVGRYLDPKERVYHVDGNRKNIDIINLKLFPNIVELLRYVNTKEKS